ncbi:MAG: Rnase Y domain-containing protein [bacterium]
MEWIIFAIAIAAPLPLGYGAGKLIRWWKIRSANKQAEVILEEAETQTEDIKEPQEKIDQQIHDYKQKRDEQIQAQKKRIESYQERVNSIKNRLEGRENLIEDLENQITTQKDNLNQEKQKYEELREEFLSKLENKSEVNRSELLESLERDVVSRAELTASDHVKRVTSTVDSHQERIARRILGRVIPRTDITSPPEVPTAVLKFPDEDAYNQFMEFYEEHEEQLTEDIDSDIRFEPDSNHAVVETLKPLDKEIAHRTLNNIIQQKKFYYDLVEKGLKRYRRRVNNEAEQAAREAMNECRIESIPDNLVDLLGVLKFRTSYGQQQLIHSKEVAHLGSLIAEEIGADAQLTRRAGLLHDVGKAIDRQRESGHAVIGAELAEEAGEHKIVTNAIGSHHGDMEPNSVESIIVAAADAISGSRPGARRENVTNYSERIQSLLELAKDRGGIKKVYAMNAGRELRVRVNREEIDDEDLEELASSIANDIEEELTYSGEIKINTIRETHITRTARNS